MAKKDFNALALELHREHRGKIAVDSKVTVETMDDLSTAYTPGVAEPCRRIAANSDDVYTYTDKGNLVAVVTDGTAVLGLGDIGPLAGMPVMEGKAILFKEFAGIDAFPICLDTKDPDEIVETVKRIAPSFGGINLEDISAPRCFEIESRLRQELDIPVFHDDQHGTAIIVAAGLTNALRLVGKKLEDVRIVFSGAGAAGISIARLLLQLGAHDIVMSDKKGLLAPGEDWMNPAQAEMAERTNPRQLHGTLADAIKDADVFIGVSGPGVLSTEMVRTMAHDAIVFAMANPTPEIMPEDAKAGGARVVATGRSDYPNQMNNVLIFPGIFRGALDARATDISDGMKMAAVKALSGVVTDEELSEDYIFPNASACRRSWPRQSPRRPAARASPARKTHERQQEAPDARWVSGASL